MTVIDGEDGVDGEVKTANVIEGRRTKRTSWNRRERRELTANRQGTVWNVTREGELYYTILTFFTATNRTLLTIIMSNERPSDHTCIRKDSGSFTVPGTVTWKLSSPQVYLSRVPMPSSIDKDSSFDNSTK